jgi:alkylation response protein AidB-like acyl-CoA dehydrogenase
MIEWSEQHQMIRDAVRRFVDAEIVPNLEELEHGDVPPYDVLRKLYATFGMDEMARSRFEKQIAREKAGEPAASKKSAGESERRSDGAGMQLIPIVELCRYCPGMVTAMGVSVGLTASAILSKGTTAQKERWALDLLTLDKIGAWAITEPVDPRDRKILHFVLEKGTPGLTQTKPMRKMGLHSSPTGELFLQDVRVGRDQLLGESEERAAAAGRSGAKASFQLERSGVAAMSLGIIERCLELSLAYARERVQFGKPIGEFQLIQDKLARMEVARLNVQNLVFRTIEMSERGVSMTLAEASAMKLYSARAANEVASEAVQIHGGNGYMAEYHVEQLARDARVLQIYAGTDEIQISAIARDLLAR